MFWLVTHAACAAPAGDPFAAARERMVRTQLEARDITSPAVLRAMREVPRHRFVPPAVEADAYADEALPIGYEQTISQPYIVALMTQLADPKPGEKVLEVGTGSGYQAAVLAHMGAQVYTIEIVAPLGERARRTLDALGYSAVHTRIGDGYQGWPEGAPFDVVLVTASPERIPPPLLAKLAIGGRLVIPVGSADAQELVRVTRTATGLQREPSVRVRFVPMTGEAEREAVP